ncbi:MAG: hypothetical protein CR993_04905 [Rhodobacterales bacterium]|nr:MAG: hypothetical protein CR993_04905 [Rhodobacterales bacterium]
MHDNVIAFTGRKAARAAQIGRKRLENNVISFAENTRETLHRHTPNGLFFTTDVLATPGDCA